MNAEFYKKLVEKHEDAILEAEKWLWKHPEPGYREEKTAKYLAEAFKKAGYEPVYPDSIPGFYAEIDTGRPGPTVLIMGELDALPVPGHPDAVDGICHACGHHLQTSALLGAALALKEPHALDGLCGKIRLMAVPSEESLDYAFREKLPSLGISNVSGKVEYMYRGMFDGVDIALMNHSTDVSNKTLSVFGNSGVLSCCFVVTGKSCHSCRPAEGINAVSAATLGITSVNAIRETFLDEEHVRVNLILDTPGGFGGSIAQSTVVNVMIRGASVNALLRTRAKVARCFAAAAASVGASVKMLMKGFNMPHVVDENYRAVAAEAFSALIGAENVDVHHANSNGGTDCGDVSSVIPMLQSRIACTQGTGHSAQFRITDVRTGTVVNAASELCLAAALLENAGEKAKKIIEGYQPAFASTKDYFEAKHRIMTDQELISYENDGSVRLLPLSI